MSTIERLRSMGFTPNQTRAISHGTIRRQIARLAAENRRIRRELKEIHRTRRIIQWIEWEAEA